MTVRRTSMSVRVAWRCASPCPGRRPPPESRPLGPAAAAGSSGREGLSCRRAPSALRLGRSASRRALRRPRLGRHLRSSGQRRRLRLLGGAAGGAAAWRPSAASPLWRWRSAAAWRSARPPPSLSANSAAASTTSSCRRASPPPTCRTTLPHASSTASPSRRRSRWGTRSSGSRAAGTDTSTAWSRSTRRLATSPATTSTSATRPRHPSPKSSPLATRR
mmetsp:Transcript_26720/g.79903  ORF Transcript_26720/g.79903 Transcript_26720/m.79903 type:complete len:219 (-) Transcript_26720:211-867(-)